MLKCDIDLEEKNGLKFEDLYVGDTFTFENVNGKFIGMKVKCFGFYDARVLLLSGENIGTAYEKEDLRAFNNLELIDLELVRR